jgi:hypothetical protein
MALTEHPHAEVPASVLADWVEQQGLDRWWFVDDDPLLCDLMWLPGPGDELAKQLRRVGRPLLVGLPVGPAEVREPVRTAEELAPWVQRSRRYAYPKLYSERLLHLKWKDRPEEWLLVEDSPTAEAEALVDQEFPPEE